MNDVINIELKELDINYKMYAPNRKTNLIERIVDNTKQPYEYEMLLTMADQLSHINPKKNVERNLLQAHFYSLSKYKAIKWGNASFIMSSTLLLASIVMMWLLATANLSYDAICLTPSS